jgi:type IV pilus assembly protein PilV
VKIAAYDIQQWATSLQAALPTDNATLICGTVTPISCLVTIRWSENVVGVNAQSAAQATANATANTTAAMQVPTYSLYIEP